jgi:hypothetical protein
MKKEMVYVSTDDLRPAVVAAFYDDIDLIMGKPAEFS